MFQPIFWVLTIAGDFYPKKLEKNLQKQSNLANFPLTQDCSCSASFRYEIESVSSYSIVKVVDRSPWGALVWWTLVWLGSNRCLPWLAISTISWALFCVWIHLASYHAWCDAGTICSFETIKARKSKKKEKNEKLRKLKIEEQNSE